MSVTSSVPFSGSDQEAFGQAQAVSHKLSGGRPVSEQDFNDPRRKAWLHSFLDENHLNHHTSPDLVASPAQIRFMVYLEADQPYYPCSLTLFEEIMARVKSPLLGELYSQVWSRIANLVRTRIEDPEQQSFLLDLLNIKYQHEIANYNMVPSRLEKRLFKLFIVTSQIEDPFIEEKIKINRRVTELCHGPTFLKALNSAIRTGVPRHPLESNDLENNRRLLDAAKLKRLFQASVQNSHWNDDQPQPETEDWERLFQLPTRGDGWDLLEQFLLTPQDDLIGHWVPRQILYLGNQAGEIVFDLAIIKFLVRLGHTVILSVKNAAIFDQVYLGDLENDPALKEMIKDADIMTSASLTQNQLAAFLRNDRRFKIIIDGTMEKLNLMRTSVTFARTFKEVDGIISKGIDQRGRFLESPFEFTRDVFNLSLDKDGGLNVVHKPKSPKSARMTMSQLEERADRITSRMREAHKNGQTVMFYSGIVGSIPGETETAIAVMTAFVGHLTEQQSDTFIINPSTFFEEGMDADDLMFMWEIVQRSGLIDIWRFQTYQDIETSFKLLNKKVPPQWVGKDSTFSTGCTKEMAIALDVQKSNTEMQIIGPDSEKFVRRSEYGIGLFHDTKLNEIYQR